MPFGGTVPFAGVEPIREFQPANANYKRPKEFDWRKKGVISHVKNQLRCGACWAFATAAVVESQHAIRNGTLFTLSEQQMIDCDQSNDGCEGGNRPNAFRYVRDNGLLQEKAYPYRGGDGNCELSPGPVDPSHRVFVDEKGPVSFGMNVTKGMFHYVGGIFSPTVDDCALHSMGRHALEVVGFGEDAKGGGTPFWILKNSWGSSWGINGGYVHVRRGVDACGLSQEVHTALITRY
uniref:Peptidase C1A papain C-terminal domain-containing protein n=1 Tax=Globodera rostochiensis TaxID=31243 RepID=A0A914I7Q8_GLORO